jgi:rhomboid-like protein
MSYVRNADERDLPGGRRESQLHAYKQQMRAEKFGRMIQRVIGVCDTLGFSRESKKEVAKHLTDVAEWYLNLPPSKQVVVPTIGTISAMFVGVNVGFLAAGTSLRKSLFRLVMHVPVSRNHLALTLSVLTHIGIFHMALNSYALWNFDGSSLRARRFVEDENGRIKHTAEASLLPHYVAFFLISGTFASLCAHGEAHLFFRMIQRRSGTSRAMRMVGLVPGIGSSGAAYALVTNWALTHRDEGLMGLIFLPRSWMQKPLEMLTYVLSAELIITILGFVRGRHLTRIGHVAHLGGALFGWLYYRYGNGAWEQTKARVATVVRAKQRYPETVPRI